MQFRGIPETTEMENVGDAVREIFWTVLDDPEADIILDRAHRALGPRPTDPSRPRDNICRLHRYIQKENKLRQAWEHGDIEAGGTQTSVPSSTCPGESLLWLI